MQTTKAYKNVLCIYPHKAGAPEKKYCPPIGLEHIAAALKPFSEKITVIDMRFKDDISNFLNNEAVDLVCISISWDYQEQAAIEVVKQIKPGAKIIVGGRHATTIADKLLTTLPAIDIIVRGDGEEIMQDIASGIPLNEISGISYKTTDKNITHNKSRELLSINNEIYPDRTLRRNSYELTYKNVSLGMNIDFLSTSRGCPFSCRFCTFTNNPLGQKRKWSGRDPQSIVTELKTIKAKFIFVVDDNFAADMKRVEALCDMIIAEKIKKTFAVAVRLDIYKHKRVLKKMYKAGFRILSVGIESAQDKTLKSMQKGFDTAWAKNAMAEIRKVNFYVHGYFIVGCIGESKEDMLAIADFAKSLRLHTISLSALRTEKFSPLNDIVANFKNYHISSDNYVYSDEYSVDQLKQIRKSIGKSYYSFSTYARIAKTIFSAKLLSPFFICKLGTLMLKKSLRLSVF